VVDGEVPEFLGIPRMYEEFASEAPRRGEDAPIVAADKLAKALGTTLSSMLSELERGSD
jgi:hypothetical protein